MSRYQHIPTQGSYKVITDVLLFVGGNLKIARVTLNGTMVEILNRTDVGIVTKDGNSVQKKITVAGTDQSLPTLKQAVENDYSKECKNNNVKGFLEYYAPTYSDFN